MPVPGSCVSQQSTQKISAQRKKIKNILLKLTNACNVILPDASSGYHNLKHDLNCLTLPYFHVNSVEANSPEYLSEGHQQMKGSSERLMRYLKNYQMLLALHMILLL